MEDRDEEVKKKGIEEREKGESEDSENGLTCEICESSIFFFFLLFLNVDLYHSLLLLLLSCWSEWVEKSKIIRNYCKFVTACGVRTNVHYKTKSQPQNLEIRQRTQLCGFYNWHKLYNVYQVLFRLKFM